MQVKHLLAGELRGSTYIITPAAADAEALRRLNLQKEDRERLQITLERPLLQYPLAGHWDNAAVSELPTNIQSHCAIVVDDYLYVIGGCTGSAVTTVTAAVVRLDMKNPGGIWEANASWNLPAAMYGMGVGAYNGKIYLTGGRGGGGAPFTSRAVYVLDTANLSAGWVDQTALAMPYGNYNHKSFIKGSILYVIGGLFTQPWFIDLAATTPAWDTTTLPFFSDVRMSYLGIAVWGSYVYRIGGLNGSIGVVYTHRLDLDNPTSWDTTAIAELPANRFGVATAILNNYLYILGGIIGSSSASATVVRINLNDTTAVWEDILIADLPVALGVGAAIVYNGDIYMIGGFNGSAVYDSTYVYRNNEASSKANLYNMGNTVTVQLPRYGYNAGKNFVVIGTETNFGTDEITLDLWG